MHLDLTRLTSRETLFSGDVRLPEDPPDAPGSLTAEGVRFPDLLHVDGTARREGAVTLVTGHLVGSIQIACSRCLTPVPHAVDLTFSARYSEAAGAPTPDPASGRGAGSADDGHELAADDLDLSFLPAGATDLDLAEVAREQVLLDLPFRVTCRPDCAGLCPKCGADLNAGPCRCSAEGPDAADPRLAPLADLRRRLKGP